MYGAEGLERAFNEQHPVAPMRVDMVAMGGESVDVLLQAHPTERFGGKLCFPDALPYYELVPAMVGLGFRTTLLSAHFV